MKLLLVIPKRNSYAILPAPDVGIAYIAQAALQIGATVNVLDCHLEDIDINKFSEFIAKDSYDFVGFKCLSIDVNTVFTYCEIIKKISPKTITVVGGPHASALPLHVMQSPYVDFVIRAEGELAIKSLLRIFTENNLTTAFQSLSEIPCLTYRDSRGAIISNHLAFETKLDDLGFPAWHLFKIAKYPRLPGGGGRFLPVITSRGCPSICTFCSASTVHGRDVRTRTPEHVIEEIKMLINSYDLEKISIFDNNFTFYKEHALTFCRLYIQNKFPVKFDIPQGMRLDKIDKDVIQALDAAGCDFVGIGVESGSQETLKIIKKGTTLDLVKQKTHLIKSISKIQMMGFFILGFPHEDEQMVRQTIDFALTLPIDYAAFTIFTPFPGTELYHLMIEQGYFKEDDLHWQDLLLDKPAFTHRHISLKRLKRLQTIAYLRFYLRPSKIGFFIRIIIKEGSFMSYLRRFLSIAKG